MRKQIPTFVVLILLLTPLAVVADVPVEIMEIGEIRRGEAASIQGEVVRILDYDEVLVSDGSGRVEVYSEGGFPARRVRVGDVITVRGLVDDGLFSLRREIYADHILFADGSSYERDNPFLLDCDDGMQ